MNRKILTTLIDILLIVAVIFLTETLTLRVIRTTSAWAYIGIYILLYATLFGAKWGIVSLFRRKKAGAAEADAQEE